MIEYISLGSNCSIAYQLKKYGLRTQSYPFDWVKINLSQLTNILEKDFNDFVESLEFKRISQKHEYFGLDEIVNNEFVDNNKSDSVILTNKYHIEFAHEIADITEIEYFKSRMGIRVDRFKNLNSNNESKQICFIRIELNPIKLIWIDLIKNLIRLLKKHIYNFKLILIINSNINYQEYFPEFVKIIKFNNFSPDWKMDELDWENIFTIK
jgi:hypothetical protein